MRKLACCALGIIFSCSANAASINLDLKPETLARALGPIDSRYHIPSHALDSIREQERLGSDRGRALLQLARDYTRAIQTLGNERSSTFFSKQILKSEFCVREVFGKSARLESAKIQGLILNTYDLARVGIRLNTHIAKSLPYLPEESTWKNECRFHLRGDET